MFTGGVVALSSAQPSVAAKSILDFTQELFLSNPKAILDMGDKLIVYNYYYEYLAASEESIIAVINSHKEFKGNPTRVNAQKFIDACIAFDSCFYISERLYDDAITMTDSFDIIVNKIKDESVSLALDAVELDGAAELLGVATNLNDYADKLFEITGIRSSVESRRKIIQKCFDESKTSLPDNWTPPYSN
jgi:hypothetical protein